MLRSSSLLQNSVVNMLRFAVFLFCVLHFSKGYHFGEFDLTIGSHPNETGHWSYDVDFLHEDNLTWDVNVNQKIVQLNGTRFVLIEARIIAPEPGQQCPERDTKINIAQLEQNGYKLLPGYGYYKAHKDRKIWADAAKTCQQEGAHLLILNSDDEALKVANLIRVMDLIGSDGWVGIQEISKDDRYVTIFDEPLNTTGFTKWTKGEPQKSSYKNCLFFIYRSQDDYGYGTYGCHYNNEFLCEKELD